MPVELSKDDVLLIIEALHFRAAEDFDIDDGDHGESERLAERLQKLADNWPDAPPIAPAV